MSRHQKPSSSDLSDWFHRQHRRMGSFLWDNECHDVCYSQHYNGRPLSVVLTEPFDPFEPQSASFFDDIPFIESDFASLHRHHHHQQHQHQHQHQHEQHQHHRSRSSGRRFKRECYSVHYPNNAYESRCFSPPPPPPPLLRRPISRVASREVLVEKIRTVTIEEQQRRAPPPPCYMVSFVRTPSPPVRQLKIRTRPSSCYDLQQESTDIRHQQRENRWSKYVDEHHEEHFQYNYNYKTPERVIPIERELPPPSPPPPPPPPRIVLHDATTSTEDFYIPRPPAPKLVRPETRETGTTTAGLPRRPLCMTETQVIERFEKTEKVRHDSTSSVEGPGSYSSTTMKRSLPRSHDDDKLLGNQHHCPSKKSQRKDFVQRMHARNGTLTKVSNSLNLCSTADRRLEKSRVIVRPTSKPREVLIDTSGIFGFPGEFSEPTSPQTIENNSTRKSRSPFQPPDLI